MTKVAAVPASCTEDGTESCWTCKGCGKLFSDAEGRNEIEAPVVIPAKGHTEVINPAVNATCTETGLTEGKHCSVCGEVMVRQEVVPAKGHTPGEAVKENEVPATTAKEGSYDLVVYCTVCGVELSRETQILEKLTPARSGGGSGGPNTYRVNVAEVENGTVSVSRTIAPANVKVTLTVTPDEGYQTAGLAVTDKDGKDVTVTKNDDGTYSFAMPASGVNVETVIANIDKVTPVRRPFVDVPQDSWFYEAVFFCFDNRYFQGVDDTHFAPQGTMTRSMFATVLYRIRSLEGIPSLMWKRICGIQTPFSGPKGKGSPRATATGSSGLWIPSPWSRW